jgi:hypothetical protein
MLVTLIPINASSESLVRRVVSPVPTADAAARSKSCAIILSYRAIAIATAKPGVAAFTVPHEVSVPSVVKYFPDCPETLGIIAAVDEDGKLF